MFQCMLNLEYRITTIKYDYRCAHKLIQFPGITTYQCQLKFTSIQNMTLWYENILHIPLPIKFWMKIFSVPIRNSDGIIFLRKLLKNLTRNVKKNSIFLRQSQPVGFLFLINIESTYVEKIFCFILNSQNHLLTRTESLRNKNLFINNFLTVFYYS
jgi:hypothetical protein